ncbi:MAG TPA: T9SS type A sorting domain-containing protein [Bacteroidetes bacterium]|nr:T9SS type A sorting domain-containing protein [Bacteroidota bacterium]
MQTQRHRLNHKFSLNSPLKLASSLLFFPNHKPASPANTLAMNRIFSFFLLLFFSINLPAQQRPWGGIDLNDFYKTKKKELTERSGDFYVVDSLYCFLFDGASQMDVPTTRQYNLEFSDDGGEVLESLTQEYLPEGNWRNSQHEFFIYDSEGNLVEQTKQLWDTLSGAWVNDLRTSNTPNANGDFTDVLNQKWDVAANGWQNLDRLILEYDQNGNIQLLEQEVWDTMAAGWGKSFRILYAQTPEGQIASTLFQLWQNAGYQNISRTFLTYDDATDLETEQVAEVWNNAEMQWFKSSRSLKDYDSSGNLTSETTQLWNAPDTAWLNQNLFLRNYNADGEVTIKTDLVWNGDQWRNFFQTENSFDQNGNIDRFQVSQWDGDSWQQLNSCDFYWRFHHVVEAVEKANELDCKMPNPYKIGTPFSCPGLLSGQAERLSVFDLSGKMVYTKEIENQNFINIAEPLPTGLYILIVSGKEGLIFKRKTVIVE